MCTQDGSLVSEWAPFTKGGIKEVMITRWPFLLVFFFWESER